MNISFIQGDSLNILITGSGGQLGSEFKSLSKQYSSYNFFLASKDNLNIVDNNNILKYIKKNNIDVIINCAGYTAVDKAEDEGKKANLINNIAVGYLAEISKEQNIKLIHISTDYVFNGKNYKPYCEDDKVSPCSVYGQTKLDGEKAMQEIAPINSIIIRTSWVYSSFGNNFVKTMIKLGDEKNELGVVYDQIGTPTYAYDLAKIILDIIPSINNQKVEIYNFSNEGVVSWYDFAKEIMKMAKINCEINPIETFQYPTPAIRPHYSVLNKSKIKQKFNIEIPYWKDSLDKCLRILGERR